MIFINLPCLRIGPSKCFFYSFKFIRINFSVSKRQSLVFVDHIELYYFALSSSSGARSLNTGHLTDNFFLGASRARSYPIFKRLGSLPLSTSWWLFIQKMMCNNCLAKWYRLICVLCVNKRLFNSLRDLISKLFLSFEIFGHGSKI